MKKFLGILSLLACLTAPALAERYEYRDYTVKKGDTLWDITKREITDPYQWPMVWKENLKINNPDRIYPGQTIRIPVSVIRQEEQTIVVEPEAPEEKPAVAAPVKPAKSAAAAPAPKETILASAYIAPEAPSAGEITGSFIGRKIFGLFDEIYIKTAAPAKKGDKFYVVRSGAEVKHPETRLKMGFIISIIGIVEVERVAEHIEARVTKSFDAMRIGDRLDAYYEIKKPSQPGRPDVSATVVASTRMKTLNTLHDVLFIDKGSEHGLKVGDLLMTLMPGTKDRNNSMLQFINVRGQTATAVVIESNAPVGIGDAVIGVKGDVKIPEAAAVKGLIVVETK